MKPRKQKKSELDPRPLDENCFEGTLQDWEARVFRSASQFSVVRYNATLGSERTTVETFPQALLLVNTNPRALIYAITPSGRTFCVPRREFTKYYKIWLEAHPTAF